jgi:hypothetical protein
LRSHNADVCLSKAHPPVSSEAAASALPLPPIRSHFGTDSPALRAHHAPGSRQALKAAKAPADDRVERSLYARANGYEYDAVKIFCNKDGVVTKVEYREHLAPDTTACIFWLKNRRKDLWRERPEAEQPLGFDPNQSIEELRDELLQDMAEAGLVKLLPAPPPGPAPAPPAGVANRKVDGTKR